MILVLYSRLDIDLEINVWQQTDIHSTQKLHVYFFLVFD